MARAVRPRSEVGPTGAYVSHSIFYAQPAAENRPFPMPLKVMHAIPRISEDPPGALKVAKEINHLAQSFVWSRRRRAEAHSRWRRRFLEAR